MVASRYAVEQVGPLTLALLRYAIGVLFLLPLLAMTPRKRFAGRDLAPVAALGIGQFAVLVALLNFALRHVSSGRAALLFATFPLMTLALAAALGREPMTARKLAGVTLTVVGVGFTLGEGVLGGGFGADQWVGIALALASALVGAVCAVLYRPYLVRYPTVQVSTFAMAASVAFLLALAWHEPSFGQWSRIDARAWSAVVFVGLSSGVGYLLWLFALRHLPPTRVTVFLALSPLTASAVGAVALGEPVTHGVMAGGAFVALGLWFALWQRR
ncbi:MAG: DMT family transporter [Ectothiorhodospiraceae bacterium]|nr:DMT family transporter [Chromatiales bacterium]MCP5154215.1 DMT family transporter [Ectothiorhodospiraceae bacterium]